MSAAADGAGHEDRRTLQRYLKPSKEGTHRRLDDLDARRSAWPAGAEELAARLAAADHHVGRDD